MSILERFMRVVGVMEQHVSDACRGLGLGRFHMGFVFDVTYRSFAGFVWLM